MKFVAELQVFMSFVAGGIGLNYATGWGFWVCLVFGSLPFGTLVLGIASAYPRFMVVIGSIFWGSIGYYIADSVGASAGSTIAISLIVGAIGAAANVSLLNPNIGAEETGVKIAQAFLPSGAGKTKVVAIDVWHSAIILDELGVLSPDAYRNIVDRCKEVLGKPSLPAGISIGSNDAFSGTQDKYSRGVIAVGKLKEFDLLTPGEASRMAEQLNKLEKAA